MHPKSEIEDIIIHSAPFSDWLASIVDAEIFASHEKLIALLEADSSHQVLAQEFREFCNGYHSLALEKDISRCVVEIIELSILTMNVLKQLAYTKLDIVHLSINYNPGNEKCTFHSKNTKSVPWKRWQPTTKPACSMRTPTLHFTI